MTLATEATPATATTTAAPATTATAAAKPADTVATNTTATQTAPTAAPVAPTPAINGEQIYRTLCFSCHDMAVANAPKLGDKAAWAPRIATGMDTLYANALKGKNAMPAKGGNAALSDDEVKAAVDFMLSSVK
jgi:cytochrome c5